ncbi:MAG: hypothetical protein ACRC8S_14590 [Fimbriiglobus sp.]
MRRAFPLLFILALTLCFILSMGINQQKSNRVVYLFGDHGVAMLAADEILGGKVLYRDVAFPYGSAAMYAYSGVAFLFGNHIETYLGFHAAFSLLFVGLTYFSFLRFCPSWVAVGGILLVLMPTTIAPGSIVGSGVHAPYTTPEKCLMIGLTLLWTTPVKRTWKQAVSLGLLIGSWQYLKFGGGVFAGGAVLFLDLLILLISRSDRTVWAQWVRCGIWTFSAVLACEASRCAIAFAVLPAAVAWDVFWPAYTKALYDTLPAASRYPQWLGIRHFVLQLLPFIVGALGTSINAWLILYSHREDSHDAGRHNEPGILIPGCFFLFGNLGYFGHVHIYMQYVWCLVWAIPLLAAKLRWRWRAVVLAASVPLAITTLRAPLRGGTELDLSRVALPTGDVVFLNRDEQDMVAAAVRGVDLVRSNGNGKILVYPTAAGFDWAYDVPRYSRDTWHIPHYVRPFDEPALLQAADELSGVVLLDTATLYGSPPMQDLANRLRSDGVFSPKVVDRIHERLPNVVRLSDYCVVLLPRKP